MKYDKNNSKKSRKLKSKKYKKKTRYRSRSRSRVHLDKKKQTGGANFVMDVSEDRENIYITFKKSSGVAYLYKINLKDKTYETYKPEDINIVHPHPHPHPHPLNSAPHDLRKIISRAIKTTAIYDIFVENDIDPSLPMKISEVSPDSRKSSSSSSRKSSSSSLSSRDSPLKNTTTRRKLVSALNFSKIINSSSSLPSDTKYK